MLTFTGILSSHAGLKRTLFRPEAEYKIKEALGLYFSIPIENITITIVEKIITIRILEIYSINTNFYTLLISYNMCVSIVETYKKHESCGIYGIFLTAKIEESTIHTNGGSAVELYRPSEELDRPIVEPFIPIRQLTEITEINVEQRPNIGSLRVQIPNGASVSFDIHVDMIIYPDVKSEDFQYTVSKCRINDNRILNSPAKRQRIEQQEMIVVLPRADEITLEMLRKSHLNTQEINEDILLFLNILREGLYKFSRTTNSIQFMFSDFKVSFGLSTTLQCLQWTTSISYEAYKRNVEFITEVNAFITTIINQFL
jgi:hypothetical protein